MLGRYVQGWIMITTCYFVTFWCTATLFYLIWDSPIDLKREVSGPFIGMFLVVVPYILAGLYARKVFRHPHKAAWWLSIVPMVSERILIYCIGAILLAGGGDGSSKGITIMMFIQGEAAPYYTPTYILMGLVSLVITYGVARSKKGWVPIE